MNSFPDTAFAETSDRPGSPACAADVVSVCGVLPVALGLVPEVGSLVAALPDPVTGGAATVMFAMVTAVGLRVPRKVRFDDTQNMLIIAVTLSVALLPSVAPNFYAKFPTDFQMIASSPITSAVIVNLLFNHGRGTRALVS